MDAAGFDPHQRVVRTDTRHVKLLHLESFVADLDDCSRFSQRIPQLDGSLFSRKITRFIAMR